jgi:uncharacterized protein with GYD domain
MARYISLLRFTEKGAQAINQSTRRAQAFDAAAEKAGVKIEGQYWTLGHYDGVLILSADKPEKALHCLRELAAAGFVKTQTLPAFTEKEFEAIVGK